jgi:hypothetical protein
MGLTEVRTASSVTPMLEKRLIGGCRGRSEVRGILSAVAGDRRSVAVSAEPDLVDRGVKMFESELEILVEQYRVGPVGLPPQRLAEIFGRFFALNACAAMVCRRSSTPVRGLSRS